MIFILDTNVLWKVGRLARLASAAHRNGHRIEIPALVHSERVTQLRRQKGTEFNPSFIEAFLKTHELTVVPFDREVAERCARVLAERYPSIEHWQDARRSRCESRFRLQNQAVAPCPATVDWYLAASYIDPSFILVTLDGGMEFEGTGAISLDSAIQIAEKV